MGIAKLLVENYKPEEFGRITEHKKINLKQSLKLVDSATHWGGMKYKKWIRY